jgi:sporulation protein YlmC with PRC-barrel domain
VGEMARYSIARLANKPVITDQGLLLGEVTDLVVDEISGKVISIIIRSNRGAADALLQKLKRDRKGNVLIPYSTVKYIREMIVVDERLLKVYIATKG